MMTIRTYQPENETDVITLWQECGLTVPWNDPKKDIQRKLDENPDLFFVGFIKDMLMASCLAGYDGHRGWIYYLAVQPAFQRRGHAKQLVRRVEQALAAVGCPKVNLMVRQTNTAVLDFYRTIGYGDDPVLVLSRRLEDDTA